MDIVRTVDRREAYYAKLPKIIATDPLSFYTRAEAGRAWQFAASTRWGVPRVAFAKSPAPLRLVR